MVKGHLATDLTDDEPSRPSPRLVRALWLLILVITATFLVLWTYQTIAAKSYNTTLFLQALAAGAAAQLVDGALGMAYGITANSLLLAAGLSPAAATASVHVAEAFTTAGSGLSHWSLGNIDRRIFGRIVVPGVIGGVAGVFLIATVDGARIRPFIAAYLFVMGLYLIYRAFRTVRGFDVTGRRLIPVAAFGGFADSVGGGGWGPVVTTTLLGAGHEPRTTIGSVNAAEFFVTLASGFSFALLIGIQTIESVAGLIVAGLLVAPFAARLTRFVPRTPLMVLVGLLIAGLSLSTILKALGV